MNALQKKSVMKVLSHLKIKAYLLKSMSGEQYIAVTYNKSGDTQPFNPYTRLGDSMRIAMLMKMDLSFGDSEFYARPSKDATNDTCMICRIDECGEAKQVYKIGNQIINCAVAMINKELK